MQQWKKNLVIAWITQIFSITGFGFVLPFLPYYIQELGVTEPAQIRYWVGLISSAPSLFLGAMAPVWGYLADRLGRKLMMLRANFSAVVILTIMSFSPNVYVFTALRLLQGMFTGTMNAAMTFVASSAPKNKQGGFSI